MPTYAYACTSCDNRFEVHQSFSDDSLTRCERCEGTLRKLFNSVGIVFKGSGFYRTDSRAAASASGGSGNGASASSGKDGKAGKDSAGSSASEGSGSSAGSNGTVSSGTKESATSRTPAAAAAKT